MKFSVVVPTILGRSEFLLRALASVQGQHVAPLEVVVVNNGSEDIKSLLRNHYLRPRVIDTIFRAGPAQARNIGATFCSGEVLSFLDDDDFWDPCYLERIQTTWEENLNPTFIVARLDQFVGDIGSQFKSFGPLSALPKARQIQGLLRRNPGVTGSTISISRHVFLAMGGFQVKLPTSQDKALAIDHLVGGGEVLYSPKSIAFIDNSIRGDRLTSNRSLAIGSWRILMRYRKITEISTALFLIAKSLFYFLGRPEMSRLGIRRK